MAAIFEGIAIGTIVLVVFHILVSIYARSLRREALEEQFDAGDGTGDRETFIQAGMNAYAGSWLPKALYLIYLIPVVAVLFIIFVVNTS
jgi:hypothetical protein